jgi:hypothetical protein
VLATRAGDTVAVVKPDAPRPGGEIERRRWSLTNVPALDENGEVAAIVHHAQDVTPRRRLPRAGGRAGARGGAGRERRRFRALFEQSAIRG